MTAQQTEAERKHEQAARDACDWELGLYATRDGRQACILKNDATNPLYSLEGAICGNGVVDLKSWTADGRLFAANTERDGASLMPPGYNPLPGPVPRRVVLHFTDGTDRTYDGENTTITRAYPGPSTRLECRAVEKYAVLSTTDDSGGMKLLACGVIMQYGHGVGMFFKTNSMHARDLGRFSLNRETGEVIRSASTVKEVIRGICRLSSQVDTHRVDLFVRHDHFEQFVSAHNSQNK